MKKMFFGLFVAMVATIGFMSSCSKCSHKSDVTPVVSETTKLIDVDKAHMNLIDGNYSYFETTFVFAGTVDTLTTPDVVSISSVFQTVDTAIANPTVYISAREIATPDSVQWDVHEGSFWMEDFDLRGYEIKVSLEEAYTQLQKANCKKPTSKYCVLRAQLGPKHCNAQYIFGNDVTGLVFVDAITGNVTTVNPAFDAIDMDKARPMKHETDSI